MKSIRFVAFAAALLTATSIGTAAENSVQPLPDKELQATLERYSEASEMFYNGKSEAVKALWSHSDDVTLSGAAGGPTAKGWDNVSSRLDWASAEFKGTKGTRSIEQIQATISGNIAYVVRYEHIRYHHPGQKELKRDYRATVIFRREPAGWRVVHRHADTLMEKQDIQ